MPTRDCSHPLDADTWTYPGDPPVRVEPHATVDEDGYRVAALSMGTHAGTHLDAPSHTEADGATVEALPVEAFALAARLVDLDGAIAARAAIEPHHLPAAVGDADCLVLSTGWTDHWGTDRYRDHPHVSAAAARWCADRGLAVAVDAPSVDPTTAADEVGPSDGADGEPTGLPAHHALLGAGSVVVENLTNLDGLPQRFVLRAYPLPIAGGDGSPVRAVAEW